MRITDYLNNITLKEGKKKSISRAQVGEVVRILREDLKRDTDVDIYSLIRKI